MRDCRLQAVETVVERQKRMSAKRDDVASWSLENTVDFGSLGPVGRSTIKFRFFDLATIFRFDAVALG